MICFAKTLCPAQKADQQANSRLAHMALFALGFNSHVSGRDANTPCPGPVGAGALRCPRLATRGVWPGVWWRTRVLDQYLPADHLEQISIWHAPHSSTSTGCWHLKKSQWLPNASAYITAASPGASEKPVFKPITHHRKTQPRVSINAAKIQLQYLTHTTKSLFIPKIAQNLRSIPLQLLLKYN